MRDKKEPGHKLVMGIDTKNPPPINRVDVNRPINSVDANHSKAYRSAGAGGHRIFDGINFPGNDIAYTCGQYKSFAEIQAACNKDKNCVGFSEYRNKPWCLKHTESKMVGDSEYRYYRKPV